MKALEKFALASIVTLLPASPVLAAVPVYDFRFSGTTDLTRQGFDVIGEQRTVEITGTIAEGSSTVNNAILSIGGITPIQLGSLTLNSQTYYNYYLTGTEFSLYFNTGEFNTLSTLLSSFTLPEGNYVDDLYGSYGYSLPASMIEFRGGSATVTASAVPVVGTSGAVPEPATWIMMLLGFGAVGYTMRRKQSHGRVTYV